MQASLFPDCIVTVCAVNGVYAFCIIGDYTYAEPSFIAWLDNKLMFL